MTMERDEPGVGWNYISRLPPTCVRHKSGQAFRKQVKESPDGSTYTVYRPIAATLSEAKAKRWDFWHPQLGWVIEGYKLATDRDPRQILLDNSGLNTDGFSESGEDVFTEESEEMINA